MSYIKIVCRISDISATGLCWGHVTCPTLKIVCRIFDISATGFPQNCCMKLDVICPAHILHTQSVRHSTFCPVWVTRPQLTTSSKHYDNHFAVQVCLISSGLTKDHNSWPSCSKILLTDGGLPTPHRLHITPKAMVR